MTEPQKPEIDFAEIGEHLKTLANGIVEGWTVMRDAIQPLATWLDDNQEAIQAYLKERDGQE